MLLSFLLTFLVIGCVNGSSPVFIWGTPSEQKPALYNIKQNEFVKIMKPKLENSMVVVFLEPELNTVDFRLKVDDSESCYSNLKKFPDHTYFTSVNKPVAALRELTESQEYAVVDEDGYLEPEIEYRVGKVVFIDLKNVDANRSMLLKKHDDTINKIYERLSSAGKVTGVYTSAKDIQRRIRRATTNKKNDGGDKFLKPEFLLYYSMLRFKENDNEPVTLKASNMDVATSNDSHLSVTLTTDKKPLTFDIYTSRGYYKMKNLKFGDEMFIISPSLEAPLAFSYVCGKHEFVATNPNPNKDQSTNSKIIWSGLQMQARFNKEKQESLAFDKPWDCSGLFSPGILSALFVVFLLLIILAIGIAWLMDINTMDRFENNRSGKTITINASD